MNTYAEKTLENKGQSVSNDVSQKYSGAESVFQFVDNRPEVITQRRLQEMINNSPRAKRIAQLQAITNSYHQGPTGTVIQKGKKKKKGKKEKQEDGKYPYMNEFEYNLPSGLGKLSWVKDSQYYTENGWMSKNLHLDSDQSATLESESNLSIHAIIAIKDAGSAIRINPHVTVRDQERQMNREEREKQYLDAQRGYQKPNKTPKDRALDLEDVSYSKQVGLKSDRTEKGGKKSLIETKDLKEVFTEDWLYKMAEEAIAQANQESGLTYEVGTTNRKFKKPKAASAGPLELEERE